MSKASRLTDDFLFRYGMVTFAVTLIVAAGTMDWRATAVAFGAPWVSLWFTVILTERAMRKGSDAGHQDPA